MYCKRFWWKKYIVFYPWFFAQTAHAHWTFPQPPAPFCFFIHAPLLLFFWILFCYFVGFILQGFSSSHLAKENFRGGLFCFGTSIWVAVASIMNCCWWWWFMYMLYNVLLINLHSFGVLIFWDFSSFALVVFWIWIFIFIFLLLWCFYPILFFIFLVVFGGFLDFSTIFFSGFCFAFTHQNGYNF